MINTFALAAEVLRFPIVELWKDSGNSFSCHYVYAEEKVVEDYSDVIIGHHPDHKRQHVISPALCALAKKSSQKYHWNVLDEDSYKMSTDKFRIKTELSYQIQGDTGDTTYFIVALSPFERKFKESKIKYLRGIGYAIYVAVFVCDDGDDDDEEEASDVVPEIRDSKAVLPFTIVDSSSNLHTTDELDLKTPSIHSIPSIVTSRQSMPSSSTHSHNLQDTNHSSNSSLNSTVITIEAVKDSIAKRNMEQHQARLGNLSISNTDRICMLAPREGTGGNNNKSSIILIDRNSPRSIISSDVQSSVEDVGNSSSSVSRSMSRSCSMRSEQSNSHSNGTNIFGSKLSGIDDDSDGISGCEACQYEEERTLQSLDYYGAPTWEPCEKFNFPMSRIPCQYHLLHDLSLNIFTDVSYVADGSNSNIYLARFNEQQVIVKMIKQGVQNDPISAHEFDVEHGMLARTNHPGIIKLLGAGCTPRRFIVLEYLDGGTLSSALSKYHTKVHFAQRLFRKPTFTYVMLLKRAHEIASAMHYLHNEIYDGATVVHRDLKPDNVGFTLDGTLKLFDLGLASCVYQRTSSTDSYAMTGQTGSLRYMAPEVALNQAYTEKVDVYSFGIMLWQMARDKVPFQGVGKHTFYKNVVSGGERPKIFQGWPERFCKLIRMCWDTDPQVRPSFAKILEELDALTSDLQKSADSFTTIPRLLLKGGTQTPLSTHMPVSRSPVSQSPSSRLAISNAMKSRGINKMNSDDGGGGAEDPSKERILAVGEDGKEVKSSWF